jgi:hypothetical protein
MNPRTLEWIALCLGNAERKHTAEEIDAARQALDAYAKQQNAPTQLELAA